MPKRCCSGALRRNPFRPARPRAGDYRRIAGSLPGTSSGLSGAGRSVSPRQAVAKRRQTQQPVSEITGKGCAPERQLPVCGVVVDGGQIRCRFQFLAAADDAAVRARRRCREVTPLRAGEPGWASGSCRRLSGAGRQAGAASARRRSAYFWESVLCRVRCRRETDRLYGAGAFPLDYLNGLGRGRAQWLRHLVAWVFRPTPTPVPARQRRLRGGIQVPRPQS